MNDGWFHHKISALIPVI